MRRADWPGPRRGPSRSDYMLRSFGGVLAFVLCLALLAADAAGGDNSTAGVRLKLGGAMIEGRPLFWTNTNAAVLATDGRLWQFAPDQAKNVERSGQAAPRQSFVRMRGDLRAEFGSPFRAPAAGHIWLAHPRAQAARGNRN